ncbi:putative nucleoside-diphosphate-sugar epimerase [Algibacter lectus]|uniref:Putative nucleoside-diphosphate-sugar epimerase n=1 Tax=Algibacter lectus TaxID=221126 RepID=A0A090WW62_9FLAO|nr:SDR family oxidoreductase [Algibacter lectus]GAL79649.1 putative nucleoside-diphosphate-sugar epimerase [Algibacter lectus]
MKILLTGSTGYIGKRLIPVLVEAGHEVICCVRDPPKRFNPPESLAKSITVLQLDLLDQASLEHIPKDIDGAYYLVHSMSSDGDYKSLEETSAKNFRNALKNTNVNHVVYLSGIVNETELSKHLSSRKNVEIELAKGDYNFTALRAGIIIGSGSASFEIIRDLVEKLPIMITPKWLNTKCQPIGISDVMAFLSKSMFNPPETYNENFDIGGPDVLTYKEMLLNFGKARNLKRRIYTVPVMTPKLSSYWLYFVTSTSYKLASSLVHSMKVEVVCRDNRINTILGITPLSYNEALKRAFSKIENNEILSSWKDAYSSSGLNFNISEFIQVPSFGCFKDSRTKAIENREASINKIWAIGGNTGWYYGTWLWKIRGYMDKLFGGVGLRRGRTNPATINVGDSIDFWRVLYADKEEGRLLLFAEMKLPGEAWLEFKVVDNKLTQTATFRPLGLAGRLYWYSVLPFHGFIFKGMLKALAE